MTGKGKGGISGWHESERPRERLLKSGDHNLSDAELIAIVLRVGLAGKSAVDLGQELIDKFGGLRGLVKSPPSALMQVKGLGKAKAAQVAAVMAIARRAPRSEDRRKKYQFTRSEEAGVYLDEAMQCLVNEEFRALYLNRQHFLLEDSVVAEGDVSSVAVSLRKIVTRALMINASALIIAHNHPSGSRVPSAADKQLTKDLAAALRPLRIKLLDHFIITDEGQPFSFADEGLLDF